MNPKNYTTLETSKLLKELGVLQKSDMCHQFFKADTDIGTYEGFALINMIEGITNERYSAFNASELGVLVSSEFPLPYCATEKILEQNHQHGFWYANIPTHENEFETESEARGQQLIDIINNGLETFESINERYTKYLEQ
jgi:hypothetical protein